MKKSGLTPIMTPIEIKEGAVRVAVMTNAVPVYRRPILEGVSRDSGIRLQIFLSLPAEQSDGEASRSLSLHYSRGLNVRWRTVHRHTGTQQIEWLNIPIMLLLDVLRFRPDLIISGEFGLRSLVAYLAASLRGVPFVIWTEEIKEKAGSLSRLQRLLRRFLIPRADAFLAWGNPAVEYLRGWNTAVEKIYYCAQSVDNDFWENQRRGFDKKERLIILGLDGRVFLAVGRFLALKGFDKLLFAWRSMPLPHQKENTLVLVGDGPEGLRLRQLAQKLSIPNIRFTGFQTPLQLAQWYAVAEALVFPSLVDVWGLVVNEAMASGLPVLASKYAGASQELVRGTGTGEIFDPNDIEAFGALLQRWCEKSVSVDPDRIRAVVAPFNFEASSASFRRMVAEVSGRKRS